MEDINMVVVTIGKTGLPFIVLVYYVPGQIASGTYLEAASSIQAWRQE
jgi:hypothetical protein